MDGRPDARLRLMAISDGLGDAARLRLRLPALFEAGLRCVQLREPSWSAATLESACRAVLPACERAGALLLLSASAAGAGGHALPILQDLVRRGLAHGLQLGRGSGDVTTLRQQVGASVWLGYSAHDPGDLATASQLGADYALLSPVWPTASKPGQAPLGVVQAAAWTRAARLPVLWLGGVAPTTCRDLERVPADGRPFGLAAIRSCWDEHGPSNVRELLAILFG